jgi:hypothetical protein
MLIKGNRDYTIEGVRKIRASNSRIRALLIIDNIRAINDSSSNSEDKLTPTLVRADLSLLNPIGRSIEDRALYDAIERLDRYVITILKALIYDLYLSRRTFNSTIILFSIVKL